jgi:hypothetical protein
MIVYATSPDSTADDGGGEHSPFTQALLSHLGRPNESILDAMIDVTNEVVKLTNNRQRPWCQQTLREKFVLNIQEIPPAPAGFLEQEADEAVWLAISASNSISVFDDFIRAYPTSRYCGHAQSRIDQIHATNEIQQALASAGLPADTQVNVPIRPFDRSRMVPPLPVGWSTKAPHLGHSNMVDPAFLEGLVAISLFSVAKIVTGDGRGIGTAFFVSGTDIFGPADQNLYAVTASHVVGAPRAADFVACPEEADQDLYAVTASHVLGASRTADFAARPEEAVLLFDQLNRRGIPTPPLPITDIVWESAPWGSGCDASVLAVGPDRPEFIRPMPIAPGLPDIDPAVAHLPPPSRDDLLSLRRRAPIRHDRQLLARLRPADPRPGCAAGR